MRQCHVEGIEVELGVCPSPLLQGPTEVAPNELLGSLISSHIDFLLLLFWVFAGWPGVDTCKLDLMSLPDCPYSEIIAQVISLSGLISQRNGLEAWVLSGGRFTIIPIKKWMNLKWLYPKWESFQENGPEEKNSLLKQKTLDWIEKTYVFRHIASSYKPMTRLNYKEKKALHFIGEKLICSGAGIEQGLDNPGENDRFFRLLS